MAFELALADLPGDLVRLLGDRQRLAVAATQHEDLGIAREDPCPVTGRRLLGDELDRGAVRRERVVELARRP